MTSSAMDMFFFPSAVIPACALEAADSLTVKTAQILKSKFSWRESEDEDGRFWLLWRFGPPQNRAEIKTSPAPSAPPVCLR